MPMSTPSQGSKRNIYRDFDKSLALEQVFSDNALSNKGAKDADDCEQEDLANGKDCSEDVSFYSSQLSKSQSTSSSSSTKSSILRSPSKLPPTNKKISAADKKLQKQQLAALEASLTSTTTSTTYTSSDGTPLSVKRYKLKSRSKVDPDLHTIEAPQIEESGDDNLETTETKSPRNRKGHAKRSQSFRGREEQNPENRTPRRTRSKGSQRGKGSTLVVSSAVDEDQANQQSRETDDERKLSRKGSRRGKQISSELIDEIKAEIDSPKKKHERKSDEKHQSPRRCSSRGPKPKEAIRLESDPKKEAPDNNLHDAIPATPKKAKSSLFSSLTPKKSGTPKKYKSEDDINNSSFLSSYLSLNNSKSNISSKASVSVPSALLSLDRSEDEGKITETRTKKTKGESEKSDNKNLRSSRRAKLKRSKSDLEIQSVSEASNTSETIYALDLQLGKAKPSFFNSMLGLDFFGGKKKDASDKEDTPVKTRSNSSNRTTKSSKMKKERSKKSMDERKSTKPSDGKLKREQSRSRSRGRNPRPHDPISGESSARKGHSRSEERKMSSRGRDKSCGREKTDTARTKERKPSSPSKKSSEKIEKDSGNKMQEERRSSSNPKSSQSPTAKGNASFLKSLLKIGRYTGTDEPSVDTISLDSISIDNSIDMKMKEADARNASKSGNTKIPNNKDDMRGRKDVRSADLMISETNLSNGEIDQKKSGRSSEKLERRTSHRSRSKGSKRAERSTDLVFDDGKNRRSSSHGKSRGKRASGLNFDAENAQTSSPRRKVLEKAVSLDEDLKANDATEVGICKESARDPTPTNERALSRGRTGTTAPNIINRRRSSSRGSKRSERTCALVLSEECKNLDSEETKNEETKNDETYPNSSEVTDTENISSPVSPRKKFQLLGKQAGSGVTSMRDLKNKDNQFESPKKKMNDVDNVSPRPSPQRAKSCHQSYDQFFRDRSRRGTRTSLKIPTTETSNVEIVPVLTATNESATQRRTVYELSGDRGGKKEVNRTDNADNTALAVAELQQDPELLRLMDETDGDFNDMEASGCKGLSIPSPKRSGSNNRSTLSADIFEQVDAALQQKKQRNTERPHVDPVEIPQTPVKVSSVRKLSSKQHSSPNKVALDRRKERFKLKCEDDEGGHSNWEGIKNEALIRSKSERGTLKSPKSVHVTSKTSHTISSKSPRRKLSHNVDDKGSPRKSSKLKAGEISTENTRKRGSVRRSKSSDHCEKKIGKQSVRRTKSDDITHSGAEGGRVLLAVRKGKRASHSNELTEVPSKNIDAGESELEQSFTLADEVLPDDYLGDDEDKDAQNSFSFQGSFQGREDHQQESEQESWSSFNDSSTMGTDDCGKKGKRRKPRRSRSEVASSIGVRKTSIQRSKSADGMILTHHSYSTNFSQAESFAEASTIALGVNMCDSDDDESEDQTPIKSCIKERKSFDFGLVSDTSDNEGEECFSDSQRSKKSTSSSKGRKLFRLTSKSDKRAESGGLTNLHSSFGHSSFGSQMMEMFTKRS